MLKFLYVNKIDNKKYNIYYIVTYLNRQFFKIILNHPCKSSTLKLNQHSNCHNLCKIRCSSYHKSEDFASNLLFNPFNLPINDIESAVL